MDSFHGGYLESKNHIRLPWHKFQAESVPLVDLRPKVFPQISISSKTELWEAQLAPFLSMAGSGGGLLNLGCGKGKTVIGCHYLAARGLKSIVVINKTAIMHQWKDELLTHLNIEENDIGWVQGSKWKYQDKSIVIASLGTLVSYIKKDALPEDFAEQFGVVLFDECHHLSADSFRLVCPLFTGERHGLTATPYRDDALEEVFFSHLGDIHYSDTKQDLIPDTIVYDLATPVAKIIAEDEAKLAAKKVNRKLKIETQILDATGSVHHRKLCATLGRDEVRNARIISDAKKLLAKNHHILALTHSVDHAEILAGKTGWGVCTGRIPEDKRQAVIKTNPVTFATINVAAEALNVRSLSALLIMTPFGAKEAAGLLQQVYGRIQRAHDNKEHPLVYIYSDIYAPMCPQLVRQIMTTLHTWGYPVIHEKLKKRRDPFVTRSTKNSRRLR